jgi:hypothetical protein
MLYLVLQSLAESCDNIYPSYTWLAEQVGYDCKGKDPSSPKKVIARALEPLVEIGLIRVTNREGYTSDYDIEDYDELFAQTARGTVDKNVTPHGQKRHTPMDKNVTPYNTVEIRREKEEDRERETLKNFQENSLTKNQEANPYSEVLPTTSPTATADSWKSEIIGQPLFAKTRQERFPSLTDDEINLTMDLMRTEPQYVHRTPTFNNVVNWLANDNKRKKQEIDAQKSKPVWDKTAQSTSDIIEIIPTDYKNRQEYEIAVEKAKKTQLQGTKVKIYEPSLTTSRIWGESETSEQANSPNRGAIDTLRLSLSTHKSPEYA